MPTAELDNYSNNHWLFDFTFDWSLDNNGNINRETAFDLSYCEAKTKMQ